jgi:biopolymer transport protein ExbB
MIQRRQQAGSARTVFLLAVTLSAAALLGLSFFRGESMVDLLARVITRFVVPVNALIMFFFAVIVSLIAGLFVHYYLFELKDVNVQNRSRARRIADILHGTDRPAAERLSAVRQELDDDVTIFGQILRRFLNDKGFSSDRPGKVWQAIQDEEFDRVKRNLMYFSLASVLAPALGFLGTAVGMVSAFYEISIQDTVTPADLAMSIQIALITTVVGLVIKTVTMMLKTMLIHSIGRREDEMVLAYQRLFER